MRFSRCGGRPWANCLDHARQQRAVRRASTTVAKPQNHQQAGIASREREFERQMPSLPHATLKQDSQKWLYSFVDDPAKADDHDLAAETLASAYPFCKEYFRAWLPERGETPCIIAGRSTLSRCVEGLSRAASAQPPLRWLGAPRSWTPVPGSASSAWHGCPGPRLSRAARWRAASPGRPCRRRRRSSSSARRRGRSTAPR